MNMDPASLNKEMLYLLLYLIVSIPVLILYLWLSKKARREWLVLIGEFKPRLKQADDKRNYVRLGTIFPVEFQKLEGQAISFIREGFTKNISRSGICMETNVSHGAPFESVMPDATRLKLIINMPLYSNPIEAVGVVKWIQRLEGPAIDKYIMGIAYDDIRPDDRDRIIKYALWLNRKPVFFGLVILLLALIAAVSLSFVSDLKTTSRHLQRELDSTVQEKRELVDRLKKSDKARLDMEKQDTLEFRIAPSPTQAIIATMLPPGQKNADAQDRSLELEMELERVEKEKEALEIRLSHMEKLEESEEVEEADEVEEEFPEEFIEEEAEYADIPESEVIIEETGITKDMLKAESTIYRNFRDYILNGNIQLLDRYCYQHRSSIYHAAASFALAEMRYEQNDSRETIKKSYKELIDRYPTSKYATYASHRLNQIEKRMPYGAYSLRYYYLSYNLEPLLDYREIEPYKE